MNKINNEINTRTRILYECLKPRYKRLFYPHFKFDVRLDLLIERLKSYIPSVDQVHEEFIDNYRAFTMQWRENRYTYLEQPKKEPNERQEKELTIYESMSSKFPREIKDLDAKIRFLQSSLNDEWTNKRRLMEIYLYKYKYVGNEYVEFDKKRRVLIKEHDRVCKQFEMFLVKQRHQFIMEMIYDALRNYPNIISVFDSIEEIEHFITTHRIGA